MPVCTRRWLVHARPVALSTELRARIDALVASDDVVLFMKGTRQAPQCGFSGASVDLLDRYLARYTTVNVLADPEVREGIKEYSDWPTIPQLYVGKEFVGGADVLRELEDSGELVAELGETARAPGPPNVTITASAAAAIKSAMGDAQEGDVLRLEINGRFHNDLSIGEPVEGELYATSMGITIGFDPVSARRAEGLVIDFVTNEEGAGFKIDNPNAPPSVQDMTVEQLKGLMDAGAAFRLIDVRTPQEVSKAKIEGAELLTPELADDLVKLPKDTKLVFQCHHGGRSARAAAQFVELGFTDVHNLVGGIDVWSQRIDPSIERYG